MKKRIGAGKSYADILTILIVIIIIAVIALLGFFTVRAVNKKKVETVASDSNEKFLETAEDNKKKLEQIKNQSKTNNDDETSSNETTDIGDIIGQVGSMTGEGSGSSSEIPEESKPEVKKEYMGNFEIKGNIYIPKTKCNYPILEKVTIDSLSKAIAIQEIVANPELNRTVRDLNVKGTNAFLLGHNYSNGQFFSDNDKLVEGDKIQITDQYKETVTYTIYKMFYTTPDDASFMRRDIDINTREITLQTCNDDSTERLIIQAKEETK